MFTARKSLKKQHFGKLFLMKLVSQTFLIFIFQISFSDLVSSHKMSLKKLRTNYGLVGEWIGCGKKLHLRLCIVVRVAPLHAFLSHMFHTSKFMHDLDDKKPYVMSVSSLYFRNVHSADCN